MQALSTLRTRWIDLAAEEDRLLRELTIAESLRQFALLYEIYCFPDHCASRNTFSSKSATLNVTAHWRK